MSISKEIKWDEKANGYRLPTVEEWQYAAKGGQEFKYSGSDNIDEVAWYGDNSGKKTHPVAQKKPNGYGLYDMSGNVSEWCWGSRENRFYSSEVRYYGGSSCYSSVSHCEVGFRIDGNSNYGASRPDYDLGFRIVRNTGK